MLNSNTFLNSLVATNKSHTFFTDWAKARKNQQAYRDELALLSILSGSHNPEAELKRLLIAYPRINRLLPLLNAIRIKDPSKTLLILDEDEAEDDERVILDPLGDGA